MCFRRVESEVVPEEERERRVSQSVVLPVAGVPQIRMLGRVRGSGILRRGYGNCRR
jgi:hypothetical protein